MVLAARTDHHVPAGIVVHDRGAWLQHDDLLCPRREARADHTHRQNHQWRREFSFNQRPIQFFYKFFFRQVVGAYCSSPWSERRSKDSHGGRQGYFGTGETFVFTLLPETKKYPWVGINAASSPDGPACVRHAAELFMASDGHMITIGGG